MTETPRWLRDFDVRSAVIHALMTTTFVGTVGSAFCLWGQLATLAFVALVNFTAGVWVCQSIHSLGN